MNCIGKLLAKKRVRIIFAGTLLAVAVWLVVESRDSTPMPVFEDKTAREWLHELIFSSSPQSHLAFSLMGTNAVPFLLHELERKDSARERFCRWMYPHLPQSLKTHFSQPTPQLNRWSGAATALTCINSRSTIPSLLNILSGADREQQGYVLYALTYVVETNDTECLPALMNCLKSKDIDVCLDAETVLDRMKMAGLAIPALTNFATSTNWQERLDRLDSLAHIDPANSNKWQQMLTNDPDWKAEQRVQAGMNQ